MKIFSYRKGGRIRLWMMGAMLVSLSVCQVSAQNTTRTGKPRIVVTCDPELDDNNSLIRFLLYSSDLQVEGLIYASSGYHWKGDGKGTKWFVPGREYARFGLDTCPCPSWRWAPDEHFIHDVVDAYAKVYPNLKVHNPGYPNPAELRSKIRYGNIEFDGDISKDSPGSELIRSLMLDNRPGPLYITAWGGQSTIARALKSIQEQFEYTTGWEAIKRKISRKVVLLPSGDQDDSYAKYIRINWPDMEYRQFRDGPNYAYGAQLRARPQDSVYMTASWMKANISDRGSLGTLYRVWGDGKQMVKGDKMDYFGFSGYTDDQLMKMGYVVWMPVQPKGSWLGEGDDPTFMNMLGNGLRAYEAGSYGGWGGRELSRQESSPFSLKISDTSQQAMVSTLSSFSSRSNQGVNAYPDFFPAAQQDFAARLAWSVTPTFAGANHAPVVSIEGPLSVLASPGETFRLNGKVSDPDKNEVTVKWWQFQVGTYPGNILISGETSLQPRVTIPKDAVAGQTIHVVLEATDNGSPALTSYQRVIITIRDATR
ncbi:MAG TPA: nucleoside hydrolase-like domain-containing protein [Chitinophagaceae bacterium]|nr:nucleoside hydrolase-like domain-containing protein [Chitinophagaceae bacterium]